MKAPVYGILYIYNYARAKAYAPRVVFVWQEHSRSRQYPSEKSGLSH
jgi:hypothetical protein